jgi:uroporphyrinogen decarboxylase
MTALHLKEPDRVPFMDLKVAKEKWGDRICLWGNIDLGHTLPYGTEAKVEAEVKQRIKDAGVGGGYICDPSNNWVHIGKVFKISYFISIFKIFCTSANFNNRHET